MLEAITVRLDQRFAALAAERKPDDYPVYAIEHGLDASELSELKSALRTRLRADRRLDDALATAWCVCAAEAGYAYDGGEYWPPFWQAYPEWAHYVGDHRMQSVFAHFRKRYRGFTPRGSWARHFCNIAPPIFHAVLPKYLQTKFVEHLHNQRYDLPRYLDQGVDALGEFLQQSYWGGSTRLEQFLQQTQLTARLVLALRDEDVQGAVSPIDRPLLQRIVADLERHRLARGMFRDTRRMLREARIASQAGFGGGGLARTASGVAALPPQRARLIARCNETGAWTLFAGLADVAAALKQARVATAAIDKCDVKLFGSTHGYAPGRFLLSLTGRYELELASLPSPSSTPLIIFERPVIGVSDVIEPGAQLEGQSPWLLRLHEDGAARQVFGNHVRARCSYLLATTGFIDPQLAQTLGLAHVSTTTAGVTLFQLTTPAVLDPAFIRALQSLGFGYAARVRIETCGLVPRWDAAAAASVWLPSEPVMLRLAADMAIAEYSLSAHNETVRITPQASDTLIALSGLPIGRHALEIRARPADLGVTLEPEWLALEVRAPRPWPVNVREKGGVRTALDPPNAGVRDLVNGAASFTVRGPPERRAKIEAVAFDGGGNEVARHTLGQPKLPCASAEMTRHMKHLDDKAIAEHIQTAPRIDIRASIDELGCDAVKIIQAVSPIRWSVQRAQNEARVRLLDDTSGNSEIIVESFAITRPDKLRPANAAIAIEGEMVAAPGALYIARADKRAYATMVCVAPEQIASLADLGVPISISADPADISALPRLLRLYRAWKRANILGPLAETRRMSVLAAFERHFVLTLCDPPWAEDAELAADGAYHLLRRLQHAIGGSKGFASQMRSKAEFWRDAPNNEAAAEFCRLAKAYGLSSDETLSRLAFALVFDPAAVRLTGEAGDAYLQVLAADFSLARGARLAQVSAKIWPKGQIDGGAGA